MGSNLTRVHVMTMAKATQSGQWYVKRGDHVEGPFPWTVIDRNVELGRIKESDRLSRDGVNWKRVRSFHDSFSSSAGGGLAASDERRGDRRIDDRDSSDDGDDRRRSRDRRKQESKDVVERRARSERVWAGLRAGSESSRRPMAAMGAVLAVIVILALSLSMPDRRGSPDCEAPGAPRVNWDFCTKSGVRLNDLELALMSARNAKLSGAAIAGSNLTESNFAYADLTGADLSLSNLNGARLVGADLRNAKLGHARMTHADLRFADLSGAVIAGADLSGAQLVNAIWIDGRICERNSIGACIVR